MTVTPRVGPEKNDKNPTLAQALCRRATSHPGPTAYRFLEEGEKEGGSLTRGEPDRSARNLAAYLHLRRSPEEHRLVLVFHPIVSDGWSMTELHRELVRSLPRAARGRDAGQLEKRSTELAFLIRRITG